MYNLEHINDELLGLEIRISNQIEDTKKTLAWVESLRNKILNEINHENNMRANEGE